MAASSPLLGEFSNLTVQLQLDLSPLCSAVGKEKLDFMRFFYFCALIWAYHYSVPCITNLAASSKFPKIHASVSQLLWCYRLVSLWSIYFSYFFFPWGIYIFQILLNMKSFRLWIWISLWLCSFGFIPPSHFHSLIAELMTVYLLKYLYTSSLISFYFKKK